jgi:O-antigen ligase
MAFLLTGLAFVLAFLILPASRLKMAAIGVLTGALLVVAVWQNPALIDRQGQQTSEVVGEISGSIYGQIWQSALAMSADHPVFGVGLRQFRELCPDPAYGPADNVEIRCNLHPHNMYLEWLVESGLTGLAAFMAMVVLWLKQGVGHFRQLRNDPLFIGLLITLCIRLWPLASTTSFFTAWSAVPFWMMVGWWLAVCRNNAAKEAS